MKLPTFCIYVLCALLWSCATKPKGGFTPSDTPQAPDYSDMAMWAAHPNAIDSADLLADASFIDIQDTARLDVFFLHPTTFIGKKGENQWNASLQDDELNERTDATSIKFQASIFNGVGKVYAPRYRQAHLEAFYTNKKKADAKRALELAYSDVEAAFAYYLKHFNDGRPFIIATHSQGTSHGARLIKEMIEGTPNASKHIASYLVGLPVTDDYFSDIEPCTEPEQIDCFCSWRTVKDGYYPKKFYEPGANIVVTNPLSWMPGLSRVPASENLGAVLRKFDKGIVPGLIDARIDDGFLMVTKPKLPGIPVLLMRNYHIADLNFFYANIRQNAQLRAEAYFRQYR